MKRNILACTLILALVLAALPVEVHAVSEDWSPAYRGFILDGGYLKSGQDYDTADTSPILDISFALHDLDSDGTPELIANSGYYTAGAEDYVYTVKNGAVRFLGSMMDTRSIILKSAVPEFSGLFATSVFAGESTDIYAELKNGLPATRFVRSRIGQEVLSQTTDSLLLSACTSASEQLIFWTVDEIRASGWDAYAASFGYSAAPAYDEVSTASGSLANLTPAQTYTPDQFKDVQSDAWYAQNVAAAYEYGLLLGNGDGNFGVGQKLTIAQTLAIADRLHNRFYGGSGVFDQTQAGTWYQVYMDYAIAYHIIEKDEYDPLAYATRAQFASILSNALPAEALRSINHVTQLPDVDASAPYFPAVIRLYNAGILTGSDEYGTFEPNTSIGREQVAAMATRFAVPSLRRSFTLKQKPLSRKNAYQAYLSVIQSEKEGITAYTWNTSELLHGALYPQQVALTDLCGDAIPELIYISMPLNDWGRRTSAYLHICTYENGRVKELYSCYVDAAAQIQSGFSLVQNHITGQSYLYLNKKQESGAEQTVYRIEREPFSMTTLAGGVQTYTDYTGNSWTWTGFVNGQPATEQYFNNCGSILDEADSVVMTSNSRYLNVSYFKEAATSMPPMAMTYEDAVEYLLHAE